MHDDSDDTLHEPQDIRKPDGERDDGRPTGGEVGGLKPAVPADDAPTIAPEEEGETPTTEHGPGADL